MQIFIQLAISEGTADFDSSANTANLNSAGSDDIYVLKLDTDANYVWAKKWVVQVVMLELV